MRNLIMDANNRFIASYIVNPCINTNGNPVGGILGFLSTQQKSIKQSDPDRVFIVWDGPNGSHRRRSINPNYKAGRKPPTPLRNVDNLSDKEKEENLKWQQYNLISLLNTLPVIQTHIEGIEADDVIAFICKHLKNEQKIIVSADKDFYQLLDENTIVSRPTQNEFKTMDDIINDFNIHPNNFALARAVDGDKSDEIDGVQGVGLKSLADAFSDLKNAQKLDYNDLKIKCLEEMKNKKKCKKIYNKVYDNIDLIQENYTIMQLTDIMFSIQKQEMIKRMLKDEVLMYDRINFMKQFSDLALGNMDTYRSLLLSCTHLHNKSKDRNK